MHLLGIIFTRDIFILFTAEDIHLDDLYTRYRQRLRKSLFRSGLLISLVACVVSILIGIIFQQVSLKSFSLLLRFIFYVLC